MPINVEIQNGDGLVSVDINPYFTPSGKVTSRWVGVIEHSGLKVNKKIIETDISILEQKLNIQANHWIKEWAVNETNNKNIENSSLAKNILKDQVKKDLVFDWEKLKDHTEFPDDKPKFESKKPILAEISPRPTFYDKWFKNRFAKIVAKQKENYRVALKEWEDQKSKFQKKLKKWESKKQSWLLEQEKASKQIEKVKKDFENCKPQAVENYFQIILQQSEYPILFEKKIAIKYNSEEKLLIVEYYIPDIDEYPKLKEQRYQKSTNSIKEIFLSDKEHNRIYEEFLYNLVLRSIYEIYTFDNKKTVNHVVFNGWVNNLNKATGKRQELCVLSIMTKRDEFLDLNFLDVDPEFCFKKLKGVAASELASLAPIPPILTIDKDDKRFVDEQAVGEFLDDSVNIAAMDWQDFEHLIRELFEKEYGIIGGEVKVTQSSRDKGVDVVAFDPDPIRGGKIIIQAKRYTNTVHIESVRALYGIMQDEGAMKGILITTSDFGADAYSFAKDKPITLLNGGNLLSMFNKHGYHGKIDLREAKLILGKDAR